MRKIKTNLYTESCERLRKVRVMRKLSRDDLADMAAKMQCRTVKSQSEKDKIYDGMRDKIRRCENKESFPQTETLIALCDALDIDIDYVLGRRKNENSDRTICAEYLGLTEDTVKRLHDNVGTIKKESETIEKLLCDHGTQSLQLVQNIHEYDLEHKVISALSEELSQYYGALSIGAPQRILKAQDPTSLHHKIENEVNAQSATRLKSIDIVLSLMQSMHPDITMFEVQNRLNKLAGAASKSNTKQAEKHHKTK